MFPPFWTKQGEVEAFGATTVYRDGTLAGVIERYYMVGVKGSSPGVYSPNEAGVMRLRVIAKDPTEDAQSALMGVSLEPTEGTTIQEVIGWQMTGSDGVAMPDWIWLYDTETRQYRTNWLYDSGAGSPLDGTWFDGETGGASADAMPLGTGFWAISFREFPQEVYLDGLVRREPEVSYEILPDGSGSPAPHLLGHGYVVGVALDEPSTTVWADGATGGTSYNEADEIWTYDQLIDDYMYAWLSVGGTWPDGTWIDTLLEVETGIILSPGQGWSYRSKGDVTWTWSIPVPY